jgi:hypothetical protein
MSNIELYQRAVKKIFPDLYYAIQLVERVRGNHVFPITSIQGLVDALLADDINNKATAVLKFEGITLSAEQASELFPLRYLPIRDENELLEKLYAAFAGFRELRSMEAKTQAYRRSIAMERGSKHVRL